MNYNPIKNLNKGYESNKQEAKNLVSMNPLSKHMSTPMQMGGSKIKGSAMMMKGPGGPGKKSVMKKGGTKKSGKLKKANPKDYDTLRKLQKSGAIKKGKKGDSKRTFGDSPAKNKGMKYDIKEASNQSLSSSARKHYAENAQAASKSGYKG